MQCQLEFIPNWADKTLLVSSSKKPPHQKKWSRIWKRLETLVQWSEFQLWNGVKDYNNENPLALFI